MKKSISLMGLFLSLIAVAELVPVSPANGVEVKIVPDVQKKVMNQANMYISAELIWTLLISMVISLLM